MSTVVVQAHPLLDSCNAALLERVERGLAVAGVESSTFRLGEQQRPTSGELASGDRLVLVYPTWNAGPPAMLLDWLHEAMAAPTEPLGSVRHLAAVTTCGSARHRNMLIGQWGRRYLQTHVRRRCAPGAELEWIALYKIDRLPQRRIDEYLDRVERRFTRL